MEKPPGAWRGRWVGRSAARVLPPSLVSSAPAPGPVRSFAIKLRRSFPLRSASPSSCLAPTPPPAAAQPQPWVPVPPLLPPAPRASPTSSTPTASGTTTRGASFFSLLDAPSNPRFPLPGSSFSTHGSSCCASLAPFPSFSPLTRFCPQPHHFLDQRFRRKLDELPPVHEAVGVLLQQAPRRHPRSPQRHPGASPPAFCSPARIHHPQRTSVPSPATPSRPTSPTASAAGRPSGSVRSS